MAVFRSGLDAEILEEKCETSHLCACVCVCAFVYVCVASPPHKAEFSGCLVVCVCVCV